MNGWFKFSNNIINAEWFGRNNYMQVYAYLMVNCYKDTESLSRGEISVSLSDLARSLKLKRGVVNHIIKELEKFSVLEIIKENNKNVYKMLHYFDKNLYPSKDAKSDINSSDSTVHSTVHSTVDNQKYSNFQAQIDKRFEGKYSDNEQTSQQKLNSSPNTISSYSYFNTKKELNTFTRTDRIIFKQCQEKKNGSLKAHLDCEKTKVFRMIHKHYPSSRRPSIYFEFEKQIEARIEINSTEVLDLFFKSFERMSIDIAKRVSADLTGFEAVTQEFVSNNQAEFDRYFPKLDNFLIDPFKYLPGNLIGQYEALEPQYEGSQEPRC